MEFTSCSKDKEIIEKLLKKAKSVNGQKKKLLIQMVKKLIVSFNQLKKSRAKVLKIRQYELKLSRPRSQRKELLKKVQKGLMKAREKLRKDKDNYNAINEKLVNFLKSR